jgi:hypothetical protein
MAYKDPRRGIEEFIEIYQREPCLWKIKSKDYQNRAKKKDAAYARLVVAVNLSCGEMAILITVFSF